MNIELNEPVMDPLEVIINPANPPPNLDYLELNDFIEVEVNIPQNPMEQAVPQVDQVVEQAVVAELPHVEGFPIPPIEDLIGEEVPIDQLMGKEPEEDEDLPLHQLVGPGEHGSPANMGGMQLPPNPF